jgi:hypothetical protein
MSEIKTYKLSPEELAEVIERTGEPTAPLNTYKSKWYTSDPVTKKRCKLCDGPHYGLGLCQYHYLKARRKGGTK